MNAAERLHQHFSDFDPAQIERVFGREFLLNPPDPAVPLAPVKRVALITEAFLPKVDGVTKTALLTLQYLKQTGRDVLAFAPDIAPACVLGVEIVPLPSVGFPGVPETRMALPNTRIAQRLEAFQPDLIHMFSPALMSVSGMLAGRNMNMPIVANYQTDLPGFARLYGWDFAAPVLHAWTRYIHNRCHVNLTPSQACEDELKAHGFKRLRRWGRGVDSGRFHPARASDTWRGKLLNGRDPASLLCIYVGRLATEKCVEDLLDVARLPGVALTIIGDGAQREELETTFTGTNTHFTGYLMGDDLPAAFASADVFAFTGPNETFGQVMQEAMASGLPSVVTDRGGAADLITDGETGFHAATAHDFAVHVATLRDQPDLRRRMATRARAEAVARPWEVVLSELEAHYTEAIRIQARYARLWGQSSAHRP